MKTSIVRPSAPKWLILDAEGQSLGRVAAKAAHVLRGKHRPSFSPHQFCGDHVIVVNIAKLKIPPKKFNRKSYVKHSGYLGHLKTIPLKRIMEERPTEAIERAVKGMLPSNRIRPIALKHLHCFADGAHPYDAQKPAPLPLA